MKQYFITYFKSPSGRVITFERWNYSRVATVLNGVNYLINNDLYRACLKADGGSGIYTAVTYKTDAAGAVAPAPVTARNFTI